ncbi:hypothetical protein [Prauserella rugosa]|uniref:Uncharacterized protein n=1 Tax=Prauserella rugosa TaxID=43354 RepID=A0A660C875_9PSEU|nr:hypothetical protein [Prauserella rugosa]KMS92665.1 hypothetical protein ACZ91_03090 [Streptomyces regensis]TWH15933.1 hypothetical protein JD82_04921 [Prauserella rugosa]TWH15996.1 hypothetical protein JD82_04984 [Prauserella rugosa]
MDPGTIAFLIVLGSGLLGGVVGGAAKDVAHIAKGREGPLPSQEAAERRSKAARRAAGAVTGRTKGKNGKPKDGYLRRLLGNAAEKRRAKNAGKRKADREWLEAHRDEFSDAGYRAEQAKLEKKAGRRARRERALTAFRDAEKGSRLKAVLAARKTDEGKTDKEVVDEQDKTDAEPAKVLPFRQRETNKDAPDANGGDDAIADEAAEQNKDGDEPERMRLDAMPDAVLAALARRDGDERQAAAKAILADRVARGVSVTAEPDEHWQVHDDGQIERTWVRGNDNTSDNSDAGTSDVGSTIPTKEDQTMTAANSTTGATGEITTLADAQHFARQGKTATDRMIATADAQRAEVERTCEELRSQLSRLEMAHSTLAGEGMERTAAALGQAAEQIQAMLTATQGVRDRWSELSATADGARSAFTTISSSLDSQTGISEQVASHSGDVAKNTSFYANA